MAGGFRLIDVAEVRRAEALREARDGFRPGERSQSSVAGSRGTIRAASLPGATVKGVTGLRGGEMKGGLEARLQVRRAAQTF